MPESLTILDLPTGERLERRFSIGGTDFSRQPRP